MNNVIDLILNGMSTALIKEMALPLYRITELT
jgi:hypothetical protein